MASQFMSFDLCGLLLLFGFLQQSRRDVGPTCGDREGGTSSNSTDICITTSAKNLTTEGREGGEDKVLSFSPGGEGGWT